MFIQMVLIVRALLKPLTLAKPCARRARGTVGKMAWSRAQTNKLVHPSSPHGRARTGTNINGWPETNKLFHNEVSSSKQCSAKRAQM